MKTILLIGACGSGKTWVFKNLLSQYNTKRAGFKLFQFHIDVERNTIILGIYKEGIFQGGDRLSMALMKDAEEFKTLCERKGFTILAEGDRFTNKTFINLFKPTIVKITNDGSAGRRLRNSNQTDRQIKSIQTRVNNIQSNYTVENSNQALDLINKIINK